ncbi:hypothetical protein EVC30_041 [Rhizobium phage RHph_Y1_11]|nr:hypothetical protein EVC30_041 [Rhizobium phage RHph_Y1_11]
MSDTVLAEVHALLNPKAGPEIDNTPGTWIRVDSGKRPEPYQTVILHTPQYGETLGDGCTGVWTGDCWQPDSEEMDLGQFPPVHYMVISFPEYQGSPEDWKNVDGGLEEDEELVNDPLDDEP